MIPNFEFQNGQCLPACIALIFNDSRILDNHPPKKHGYMMTEIGRMLPDGVWFDLLGTAQDLFADLILFSLPPVFPDESIDDIFVPFICETTNHAILMLVRAMNQDVFWFDALNNKSGKTKLSAMNFEKTKSIWTLNDFITNSVLGLNAPEIKHLIK
jgi:hypothetical protein